MLSFFPLDVLNEIWDLIESVSEGFLTYSSVMHVLPSGRKSRKENPQKLTQLSSRSHPRHLVGKKGQHKKTPS